MSKQLHCMYCGSEDGHSEMVETLDHESKDGWEDWFCCHPCRDAGLPCETFFRIPKDAERAAEQAEVKP